MAEITEKEKRALSRVAYRGRRQIKKQLHQQLDEIINPIIGDLFNFALAGGGMRVVLETGVPEGVADATVASEKPLIEVPKIEVVSR